MSSANQVLCQSYVKVVWCHDVGGGCRAVDSAGAVVLWCCGGLSWYRLRELRLLLLMSFRRIIIHT